ncbi:MAG: ImmA/IrrE family metallo-endopeptidase [Acidobacteriia bacterium]|nr:ImmA/IrrE family metallo-endopeptidase [Terriglobia bacterium]
MILMPRFQKRPLVILGALPLLLAVLSQAASPQEKSSPLLDQADSVLKEMSDLTGLPIKGPLKKEIVGRAEVRKYLVENLHQEMSPHDLHVQEATLQAFGLVSQDFDLENFLIAFYTEQAAGFYDPIRKTMFIADWPPPDQQRLALAHELTHALQDQNFDLDKFLHAQRANDDATNVRQAVVEVYATAAMMEQLVAPVGLAGMPLLQPLLEQVVHSQFDEFPNFSTAPYFFRFEALFPYIQGLTFMQRGLQGGGWKKLNAVFDDPPTATKEIFDPALYFEKKPLPPISLPRPQALDRGQSLKFLSENTMGEMGYYAVLAQFISENEAKTVGGGWLADRYILYERSGSKNYALVARTRWNSTETALAFFRDYHTILAHKFPELSPDKHSGADLFVGTAANGQVILLRQGDECRWAEGVPAAQTDALLAWLRVLKN